VKAAASHREPSTTHNYPATRQKAIRENVNYYAGRHLTDDALWARSAAPCSKSEACTRPEQHTGFCTGQNQRKTVKQMLAVGAAPCSRTEGCDRPDGHAGRCQTQVRRHKCDFPGCDYAASTPQHLATHKKKHEKVSLNKGLPWEEFDI
jgi:hypothetical protein